MQQRKEIPDTLLTEARKLAGRQGTTLRVLIVEGLRRSIAERKPAAAFRLRRATFNGTGLPSGVASASWKRIRELAYEGRGG